MFDPSQGTFHEENVFGRGSASQTVSFDLVDPNGTPLTTGIGLTLSCGDDDGFCHGNESRSTSFNHTLNVAGFALSDWLDPVVFNVRQINHARIDTCLDSEDICRVISNAALPRRCLCGGRLREDSLSPHQGAHDGRIGGAGEPDKPTGGEVSGAPGFSGSIGRRSAVPIYCPTCGQRETFVTTRRWANTL